MASISEMFGPQVSDPMQGSENAGADVPLEVGADDLTTDLPESSAQDSPTQIPHETESRDVAQELSRLLRDVFMELRQDLGPPSHLVTTANHGDVFDVKFDTLGETTQTPTETPMIPEVRKVDFEHFKNYFHESDGRYIIEALVAGSRLPQAVREEKFKREERGPSTFSPARPTVSATSVTPGDGTIRRVRIRSKSILYYLSRLVGTSTQLDGTRTFLYPFVPLLYFQEEMRRVLNLLEEKWTPSTRAFLPVDVDAQNSEQDDPLPSAIHEEVTEEPAETTSDSSATGSGQKSTVTLDSGFDTPSTLEEFRSYVAFVDQDLRPLEDRYRDTSRQSITFEELWLLFKPGDYIAATIGPKTLLRRKTMPNGKSRPDQVFGDDSTDTFTRREQPSCTSCKDKPIPRSLETLWGHFASHES